ncbi:hypothetical protein BG011_006499 [Mortierella polycephala]|uniref:F-box domain-containing protein n=1 Tax=Mortierella polycephala TaxID=41804 RepID=A0A9P6TZG6_9FUNG|nr:hypothetical protein BG011_006499 [Mortierella polycephala]
MSFVPKGPSLESLPLECIQAILENLSNDCRALYGLLLMNKAWFQMVLPFLYRSPMTLIDATWPKLSPYSQVLKKEVPPTVVSTLASEAGAGAGAGSETETDAAASDQSSSYSGSVIITDDTRSGMLPPSSDANCAVNSRIGRSVSSARRTSTASSTGGGYGYGYAPRNHSRSSSHSSTRSMTGDAFQHGRNEAVLQKDQRERLVKRKKMLVLWVFLNCTLSEKEHRTLESIPNASEDKDKGDNGSNGNINSTNRNTDNSTAHTAPATSLLSQDRNPNLDMDVVFFRPMVDYLSHYTHYYHPGLRFIIWKMFPTIEDAFTIEWRLINHCPWRIRELFLESVQLQDMVPLVAKLETLHRIRTCHESWDVHGSIEFMRQHNQLFGTVRMLELEAYLPDNHDTVMNDDISELISQVDHLKVLELSGFETLRAQLDIIPRRDLKVLRLNCGSLNPDMSPTTTSLEEFASAVSDTATASAETTDGRMSFSTFLSQCRQMEDLMLKPVDENILEWAVQERRDFQAGHLSSTPSSPSPSTPLAHEPAPHLVPLRTIELSGTDSEHVALAISQAAEAFQDTLEVIKANSYSYKSNRTQRSLSWRCPMPRLRILKIVGRSNLPFDFRSLQYCPALKVLDLSKYSGMRTCSEALLLNIKYLTRLEYLGLSSFDHLTDSTLRTILGCMPGLKHLRLAIGDSASSATVSSAIAGGSGSGKGSSSARASGIFIGGSGSTSIAPNGDSDMLFRSPFSALSLSSSSAASSTPSPVSSFMNTPPAPTAPQQQPQQPTGTFNIIVGQIQNQHTQYSYHQPPPPPSISSSPLYQPFVSTSASGSGTSSAYDMASSARSTSSLMDRFQLENTHLSLEGILDAIDGFSDNKDQLEKLSIVLGKLDFEDHYRRLEVYNQQHPRLEITVYRYAHAV